MKKNIGLLLLMLGLNANAQEIPMEKLSANEIIQRNTRVLPASEVPYSLVQVVRSLMTKPPFSDRFTESDKTTLASYRQGAQGLAVLKDYKPLFEAVLNSEPVDVVQLGRLMSESREAEQMVYMRQLTTLLDSLSEDGQRFLRSNISEIQAEAEYAITDWEAVARDRPEIVLEMANDFVRRIDKISPAQGDPIPVPLNVPVSN